MIGETAVEDGPELTFKAKVCASVLLHRTGCSCIAQHSAWPDDRSVRLFCYSVSWFKPRMARHEIKTDRLWLRRWKPKDHAPFAAICGDPNVMRYIGNGATRSADDAARYIGSFEKEWDERGFGLFAVEAKESGYLLGFTGFSWPGFLPEVLPSVEIGWRFSKASWGRGYASEAASAALAFGVEELALTDIVSIYQIGNGASARIMQKLGMILDRRMIDPTCNREVEVYRLPNQ